MTNITFEKMKIMAEMCYGKNTDAYHELIAKNFPEYTREDENNAN